MPTRLALIAATTCLLTGCAGDQSPYSAAPLTPTPATDRLLTPAAVDMAHLQYTPDYQTFAPVMTERTAYPTQTQANDAYQRSLWPTVRYATVANGEPHVITARGADEAAYPTSIRLFACKPGGLDGITGRVSAYRAPVVVCATDFLDAAGASVSRQPLNFYYYRHAWRVQDPAPSYEPPPWSTRETSPPSAPWWKPFGDRY